MNRTVMVVGSWLAVLAAAAAAFFVGIEAALAVLGVLVAVVFVGWLASLRDHGSAPVVRRIVEPTSTDEDLIYEPVEAPMMPSRKFGMLLVVAFCLHLVAVGVLNMTSLNRSLAPDSWAFRYCGLFLAESWADPSYDAAWHDQERPRSEICPTYKARSMYQHLNGVVEYMFGSEKATHVLLGFMNMLLSFVTAFIFGKCATRIYGRYAGQLTVLYIAFFPSLIVWTSINLRESWSFFMLGIALYAGMNLREKFTAKDIVLFAGSVALLVTIRGYLVAIIALATLLSYAVVRVRQIPTAIVTLSLVFFITSQFAARFGFSAADIDLENQLELANSMHRGLAYGGSAFGADADISTPAGALLYLPKGLAMFLLAPFPWTIDSWRQILAVGETMVWYVLLFRALRQMWHTAKHDLQRAALPISMALMICISYGLIEGNAGTAYRHRAHAVLIFLMFTAGDVVRKRHRAREVSSVSEPLAAPPVQRLAS